jgi:hypothetical protein
MMTPEPVGFMSSVTVCRVLVQQLLMSKSTRWPALIVVNGVPVRLLLNQFPGSSVRFIVSTAPPSPYAVGWTIAVIDKRVSAPTNVDSVNKVFFMMTWS